MSEPFDIKKMLLAPFTGLYWVKCLMIGLGIGMLVFTGIGLYRGYFKKPEPTTTQKAERIDNFYYQPKSTFGCASVRVKELADTHEKGVIVNAVQEEKR